MVVCPECGEEFKNNSGLAGHQRLSHQSPVPTGREATFNVLEEVKDLLLANKKGVTKVETDLLSLTKDLAELKAALGLTGRDVGDLVKRQDGILSSLAGLEGQVVTKDELDALVSKCLSGDGAACKALRPQLKEVARDELKAQAQSQFPHRTAAEAWADPVSKEKILEEVRSDAGQMDPDKRREFMGVEFDCDDACQQLRAQGYRIKKPGSLFSE